MWGEIKELDPLAVTDARGNFVITSRREFATLDLKAEARGFANRMFLKMPAGGDPANLQLTDGAALTGRVMWRGQPLANVEVGLVSEDRTPENFTGDFKVGTDAAGRFAFVNLPPHVRYYLYGLMKTVAAYGGTSVAVVEAKGDGGTTDAGDLAVVPAHRLSGQVVLDDSQKIPRKTRLLVGREDAWDSTDAEVSRDGSFNFDRIPNGPYSLSVAVPGYRFSTKNASLDLQNPFRLVGRIDHEITNLVILMEKGATLESQASAYTGENVLPPLRGVELAPDAGKPMIFAVTDKETGEPIASFRVTPGRKDEYRGAYWNSRHVVRGTNGSFVIYLDAQAGETGLKIEAPGYSTLTAQPLAPGLTGYHFALTKASGASSVRLLGNQAGAMPSGFIVEVKEDHPVASDTDKELEMRRRVLTGAGEPAVAQGNLSATSDFVKYMVNPPWIKQITYATWRKSINVNAPDSVSRAVWQLITNLTAVQPSGFFEQELTTEPAGTFYWTRVGEQNISGVSEDFFWRAYTSTHQLMLSPRRPGEGASELNNPQMLAGRKEEAIERIRHFGLPALRPNSFDLHSDGEFFATTRDGKSIRGKILESEASRPVALLYSIDGTPPDVFKVNYRYNSTNTLPSYIEVRKAGSKDQPPGKSIITMTSISQVDYGTDPEISGGYKPLQFYPDMQIFTSIQVWKNGERYGVNPDGREIKIAEASRR